jgi:nitrate reductase NapA
MNLTRRDYLKANIAGGGSLALGTPVVAHAANLIAGEDIKLQWSKAPCRFCGTGCGVMVGTKDGKVVATHADMQAEVNRGLNCVRAISYRRSCTGPTD